MPAPTPTPPLRYISHRRLTSPLASAASDATRSNADENAVTFAAADSISTAAKLRYAPTRRISEEEAVKSTQYSPCRANAGDGVRSSAVALNPNTDHAASSPSPPFSPPPARSLVSTGGGADGDSLRHHGNNNDTTSPTHSDGASGHRARLPTVHVPPASTTAAVAPSLEDCQFMLHALRHENQILRQRIEVLTSSDVPDHDATGDDDGGGRAPQGPEVPRDVLLRRIARLEAALRLEALERDVVEQRLLAQERVLRAVCSTPAPPVAPAVTTTTINTNNSNS